MKTTSDSRAEAPRVTTGPARSVRVLVWDLPLRLFHWLLAACFVGAYAVSESERLRLLHVYLGYVVAGLLLFRAVWGFVGSRYSRFASFAFGPRAAVDYLVALADRRAPRYLGHNPAGSWATWALLALAAATAVTGYLRYNELGGESLEELHELVANAWLVAVLVHVAGVIVESLAHRENLVRAMVSGYKER